MKIMPSRLLKIGAFLLALLLAAVLFVVAVQRGQHDSDEKNRPAAPVVTLVRTAKVKASPQFETRSFPGVAKESQAANLSFRVAGPIIESRIKVGLRFNKGQMIARIDPRDYEVALARLTAELDGAKATLHLMEISARDEDLASLEAQLKAVISQTETAEVNLRRFTALLADQAASQAQYDLAKTQYDTARAQRDSLQQQLVKARKGSRNEEIDVIKTRIAGLEASVAGAKNALDDTVLRAPFDGFIVEKFVEGHENVAPALPILSFVNATVIDVAASLPEEIVIRHPGIHAVRVEFEAYPGIWFPAEIKEIGRAIQRGKQTYPMEVRIDWSKQPDRPVYPGMVATLQLDLTRPDEAPSLEIPLTAILGNGKTNEASVWVVQEETVTSRPIVLKRLHDDKAEVTGSLKAGDHVVTAGVHLLHEGQQIRILESEPGKTNHLQ